MPQLKKFSVRVTIRIFTWRTKGLTEQEQGGLKLNWDQSSQKEQMQPKRKKRTTDLPALVTIISVPRAWNSSHKLFISRSTLAFISPAHNGLTLACEQEDWVVGGLEFGEWTLSPESSESSGISGLSALLKGVLLPVPAFMRRSVKKKSQITDDDEGYNRRGTQMPSGGTHWLMENDMDLKQWHQGYKPADLARAR